MTRNRHPLFCAPPDSESDRFGRPASGRMGRGPALFPSDPTELRACVMVAVEISSLLVDVVEHHADRTLIVVDVVRCWWCLPQRIRQEYAVRSGPTEGLLGFACDYLDAVDLEAYRDWGPRRLPAAEARSRRAWAAHLTGVRDRRRDRLPPPERWLDRFPL